MVSIKRGSIVFYIVSTLNWVRGDETVHGLCMIRKHQIQQWFGVI